MLVAMIYAACYFGRCCGRQPKHWVSHITDREDENTHKIWIVSDELRYFLTEK